MKPHPSETFLFPISQQGPFHPMTKPQIIKNVIVLSVGCLVLFTAYEGLSMLQSTVNTEQGIGVMSQAVLYICFCVSALVFPKYVIKKLGSKLTLVLSMLCYIPYVGSNFYPHWSVMMPTSILLGFGAALLWGSQANYLNDVSVLYAELLLVSEESATGVNGKEESCSIHKQAVGGCLYGSLSYPSERKEADVKVLTAPQEIGPSNTDRHRLSSFGEQCTSKSKSDRQNLEQIILEQLNMDGLENLDKDVCVENITTTQENKLSNLGGVSVELPTGSRYSCEHKLNGQYRNSEQITKKDSNGINNEGFISNDDTESEEHFCKSISADRDCGSKRIYSILLPNDSARSHKSNISRDIELKQKDLTDDKNIELNQKDSVLRCPNFLNQNIDPNRKSVIDSTNTRRKRLIESTTARFFGFHGMVYLSSFIWSNLLSYFLMRRESQTGPSTCACGSDFCDADSCHRHNDTQVMSDSTRYLLTGVCVCLGLSAVLFVWLLLDPLDDKPGGGGGFEMRLLTATLKLAKRTELVLLMPMSLYLGMATAFYSGDITKSFIGCAMGVNNVGLVSVTYGAWCALSALLSGWAVRTVGRPALFTGSALLNAASCAILLAWTPDAERPIVFFVAAGMWGLYVGITFSQIRAYYGVLFKADEEAAFATFHTWYSLGFFISFVYSNFLCTNVKIYVLIAVSAAGFAGYLAVERRHASKQH